MSRGAHGFARNRISVSALTFTCFPDLTIRTILSPLHRIFNQYLLGVAYLACGIADGSIEVVKISQTLECSGAEYSRTFDVKISYDILPSKPALEDGKKITALEWVEPKNKKVNNTFNRTV